MRRRASRPIKYAVYLLGSIAVAEIWRLTSAATGSPSIASPTPLIKSARSSGTLTSPHTKSTTTITPSPYEYGPIAIMWFEAERLEEDTTVFLNEFVSRINVCGPWTDLYLVFPRYGLQVRLKKGPHPFQINVDDIIVERDEESAVLDIFFLAYNTMIASTQLLADRKVFIFTNMRCEDSEFYPDVWQGNLIPAWITPYAKLDIYWVDPAEDRQNCSEIYDDFSSYHGFNLDIWPLNTSREFLDYLPWQCKELTEQTESSPTTTVSGSAEESKPTNRPPSNATSSSTPSPVPAPRISAPMIILLVVVPVMILLIASLMSLWLLRRRRIARKRKAARNAQLVDPLEIKEGDLEILRQEKLGEGHSAIVYKGLLLRTEQLTSLAGHVLNFSLSENGYDRGKMRVAAKISRNCRCEGVRYDTLEEIRLLRKLGPHRRIVNLIGYVTASTKVPVLVFEFCVNGDLLSYLRRRLSDYRDTVTMIDQQLQKHSYKNLDIVLTDLLRFARQVADGMVFLSSKGYIHRDLAARNVLLTADLSTKISDFGLCRFSDEKLYTMYRNVELPIKWLSPETLVNALFTVQTDVWSYGILLYEMFSAGKEPYEDLSIKEVPSFVTFGGRLKQPKLCPLDIYELICQCWSNDPAERPTFEQIRSFVDSRLVYAVNGGQGYAAALMSD